MFVRCKRRFKDGKEHRYWSVVENVRVRGGRRVVQRHVLYLGEINDSQRAAWCRSIEVVEGKSGPRQMALFPNDRDAPALDCEVVRINVSEVSLHDPRQWGACWLALNLWGRLDLDRSYEGPSVKRRARCDLQHSCLSSGFLFQASLGSGSASGVDGSERVGTGRAVWRAPNSYPGGRRQHRRSVPRSRLLCGHHVPEVGPIFWSASFSPAVHSVTHHPAQRRPRPAGPGTRGLGLRRRVRRWARDRCWHSATARSAVCGPGPRS